MTILFVSFPDNFEQLYNKYKARILGVQKSTQLEKADTSKVQKQDERPYCISENGIGYLTFNKNGEKIKISKAKNQPFKLLQCLTEPFGIAKSVETVFEAIRENMKKKSKNGVYTSEIDTKKKNQLIEYVIKELQKDNKLKGKLEFKWDDFKTKLWLEYIT